MPASGSVFVLIVNYNGGAHLPRCLEALERQTFRGFRTIVVENASTDGSADTLESRCPPLTVLRPGNYLCFPVGNNLAIIAATGCKWIVLLNPDASLDVFPRDTIWRSGQRHVATFAGSAVTFFNWHGWK